MRQALHYPYRVVLGGAMDSITSIIGGVNWEAVVQLTLVAAIMISGPIVIFLLAANRGDM
ncbi:MAG: photosystem II reaction center protein Ycf12 [Elainellaceae cyanobacterium]